MIKREQITYILANDKQKRESTDRSSRFIEQLIKLEYKFIKKRCILRDNKPKLRSHIKIRFSHGKKFVPPTINNVPVIQKLAYIHNTRIAKSPTINIPGV